MSEIKVPANAKLRASDNGFVAIEFNDVGSRRSAIPILKQDWEHVRWFNNRAEVSGFFVQLSNFQSLREDVLYPEERHLPAYAAPPRLIESLARLRSVSWGRRKKKEVIGNDELAALWDAAWIWYRFVGNGGDFEPVPEVERMLRDT